MVQSLNGLNGIYNNNKPVAQTDVKAEAETNSAPALATSQDDEPVRELSRKEKRELEKAEKQRIGNEIDGIIQGGRQGSTAGDCWLLSQMNSLSKTSWGREALAEAIKKNDDGSYSVNFKGAGEVINISEKEFSKGKKNSDFSSGDADALILEIAVEKYFQAHNVNNGSIKGNDVAGEDSLQFLLLGVRGRQTTNPELTDNILKMMADTKDMIAATYTYYDHSQGANGVNHVISVQDVTKNEKGEIDKVYLKDSYQPDKVFAKSYNSFKNGLKLFGYITKPAKPDGQ